MAARGLTVAQTDFPPYSIRVIGDRHLLIGGGGGAVKTGIPNAMTMYELRHEQKTITARKVTHYETESRAVMNCDVRQSEDKHFMLAAGMEGQCQLYVLRYKVITPKVENEVQEGLRKRKGNLTNSNDHRNASKMIGFEVEPGEKVETDKAKEGGFQKAVRFIGSSDQIVTAGADGHFRIWKVPDLKLISDVKAHEDEVDDVDVSPDFKQIATVSRDSHAYIWNASNGNRLFNLEWKSAVQYRFRNCRYGKVIDKGDIFNLYTTLIPVKRGNKKQDSCYIVKWDPLKAVALTAVQTGGEILSALAVSDNGIYLAVGTISGSVSVYISFNLQRLYHLPEAHNIFVTGLDFASTDMCQSVVGSNVDFTLFSISADNQIKMHQQDARSLYSPLWAIVGFLIVMFLIFWFISALGL